MTDPRAEPLCFLELSDPDGSRLEILALMARSTAENVAERLPELGDAKTWITDDGRAAIGAHLDALRAEISELMVLPRLLVQHRWGVNR